jgi:hypothetical protein
MFFECSKPIKLIYKNACNASIAALRNSRPSSVTSPPIIPLKSISGSLILKSNLDGDFPGESNTYV